MIRKVITQNLQDWLLQVVILIGSLFLESRRNARTSLASPLAMDKDAEVTSFSFPGKISYQNCTQTIFPDRDK